MRLVKWGLPLVAWLALVPAASAAPRAVIISGPPATTIERSATFTFAASSSGGLFTRFECHLDGAGWAPCASPHSFEGLTAGSHTFQVRLTGLFTDPTPATAHWTIETKTVATPPPISEPSTPSGPDDSGCKDATASRLEVSARAMAAAALCLLNHERATRGLRALAHSGRLAAAARRHVRDMTSRGFFAHDSPGGGTMTRRVASTGYLRGARFWALGEVLAWARGNRGSARVAVGALMRSRPHRRVILDPIYREVGIAVVKRSPVRDDRAGMTLVANFGRLTR